MASESNFDNNTRRSILKCVTLCIATIVAFSTSEFMATGNFFMNDFQILLVALSYFFAIYIPGKIFPVISAIAGKGRNLQVENNITS